MNWYRAKTILIIFFIFMNAFLLANLIYSTNKSDIVTPEIISSTIDVLARNNIEIEASIIPEKTVSMKSIEMKNAITDKDSFIKTLCGNNAVQSQQDVYVGENGSVKFEGDRFIFTASDAFALSVKENAELTVKSFMTDAGIDLSDALINTWNENNNTVIRFTNHINEYKIFDSNVTAVIAANGKIISIDGVWFNEHSASGGRLSLKNITSVLIDFILKDRPQGKNVITALELGYTASDANIYHESTVLLPVWQITLSDGSTYCIDTRE